MRHSNIFSRIKRTLRDIQVLLRHIEPYSNIFRTLCNTCIYNRAIFRILAYLEIEESSKVCWTNKMIKYIQSPGIVRTVYSTILKNVLRYSGILMHIHLHLQVTKGKLKNMLWFWKKGNDFIHFIVKFAIQNAVLRVSRRNNFQIGSLCHLFSSRFSRNVDGSALVSQNFP